MEILLALLSSVAAFLVFIQFLINRHDRKKGILAEILDRLENLETKIDKKDAISARRNILMAADELRNETGNHSQEWWVQVLDDVREYEQFCEDHEDFINSRAVISIKTIHDAEEKEDF